MADPGHPKSCCDSFRASLKSRPKGKIEIETMHEDGMRDKILAPKAKSARD